MDFHQLYVFTKVVEHKSFSKAANAIFLSQSTISAHIQALEKMLKVKLFDRVGRESIPTPHGERLYEWAQKILLLTDQALLDIKKGMTDLSGVIRITASSVPSQWIMPDIVRRFRDEYPSVTFHINQSPSKIVADKVLNGSVDVGILGEKYENEKLHYIPILKEKLVLITSNKSKMTKPVVKIEEISKYPLIMRNPESGTNAILQRILKKHQIQKEQLNIVAYTDSQSLVEFVIQDIGISIISEIAAQGFSGYNLLRMHEIEGFNEERYFYLVYNKQKTLSLISKLFIEKTSDYFK